MQGLPLYWACKSGSEGVVKLLLQHETDYQIKQESSRLRHFLMSENWFNLFAELFVDGTLSGEYMKVLLQGSELKRMCDEVSRRTT